MASVKEVADMFRAAIKAADDEGYAIERCCEDEFYVSGPVADDDECVEW